jgi:hypothetical protein
MAEPSLNFTPGRSLIVRMDLELLVDLVELLADVREHDAPHVRAREGGVEDVRILVQADHELLLLGVRREGREPEDERDHEADHPRTLRHLWFLPVVTTRPGLNRGR